MYSITAIIPAYNEEKTIGAVIKATKDSGIIDHIVIVSDGSTDATSYIAKSHEGVEVIVLDENVGKGAAIVKGLERFRSDIVLMLDADLVGLTPDHVRDLLYPIIQGEADMTVGLFKGGRISTDIAQRITPYLSGQRAIKRAILDHVPHKGINKYGLEAAITDHAKKHKIVTKTVLLHKLTHLTKEEKMGIIKGFSERMRMYKDVAKIFKKKKASGKEK